MGGLHADRRRRFAAALALAAAVAGAVNLAGCSGSRKRWVRHVSPEGGFRADFPIAPSYNYAEKAQEHRHTAVYRDGRRVVRVCWGLNEDKVMSIGVRLFNVYRAMKATDFRTDPLELDGHQGMEGRMTFQRDGQVWHMRHRIYYAGDMMYQVIAMAAKGENADADFDRFFRSFRLTGVVQPQQ